MTIGRKKIAPCDHKDNQTHKMPYIYTRNHSTWSCLHYSIQHFTESIHFSLLLYNCLPKFNRVLDIKLYFTNYWHYPHSMRSRAYDMIRYPSVCSSVRPSVFLSHSVPANSLLWARRAGYIDRLLQRWRAAGKCGQCHVASVRK